MESNPNKHEKKTYEPAGETPISWAYELPSSETLDASLERARTLLEQFNTLKAEKPEKWEAIKRQQEILWTSSSNQIEGSTLTFSDTLFFLNEGITVEGKPFRDYVMAIDHEEAIQYLNEAISEGHPISETFLKELNALVRRGEMTRSKMDELSKLGQPGEYKKAPNFVRKQDLSVHEYLAPHFVPEEMEKLVAFCQGGSEMQAITKAALAHWNFVRIHPFADGNGRVARLLMNMILMKSGQPPAIIPMARRRDYITALETAQSGNPSVFPEFIADCYCETLDNLVGLLENGKPNTPAE